MKKNIILLLCSTAISYPMEHNIVSLVASSTRETRKVEFFPEDILWQTKNADLSHTKSYNGTAITMDLEESNIPGAKHIVGDACIYDFKKQSMVIEKAYIERPPTLNLTVANPDDLCYLGNYIANISKAMPANGLMEIEWHPYSRFYNDPKSVDKQLPLFDETKTKKDPFTTRIELNLFILSMNITATNVQTMQEQARSTGWSLPEPFLTRAITLSKTIDELLTFYEKNNLGKKNLLKERLGQEMFIFKNLLQNNQMVLLPEHGPLIGLEKFTHAIKNSFIAAPEKPSLIGKKETIRLENGRQISGVWYSASSFIEKSLSCFILNDAFVTLKKQSAIEFMKKNFFKNVTVKRGTSPHNNRKNVWLIKGTKIFNGAADEKKLNSMPLSYLLFLGHVLQLAQKN